ncbi:MAG TPA: hypothetical protein DD789_11520 [Firmicutes bacterium]|jgi:hypothetical protein|nr:hypothetical protein [Bacillota bacterium]
MTLKDKIQIIKEGINPLLFPKGMELLSSVTETYELELAYLESKILDNKEIIKNGAYFTSVDDILTHHYLMCEGEPVKLSQYSSSKLKSYFNLNQFKTGYATHGLFPYRGKFHPQMIKSLLNIMGLKKGDLVLDPMMGSGTTLIEAKLMGIRSIGIDISPFCRFMTQTKLDALTIPHELILKVKDDYKIIFYYFDKKQKGYNGSPDATTNFDLPEEYRQTSVFNLLLLAYLDSVGYVQRSEKGNHLNQFRDILERYVFVVEKIQGSLTGIENELAEAVPMEGDARRVVLEDNSIDGIIFSPPYSFAIDYLKNDLFHLKYLGANIKSINENMVGLRGKTLQEKYELYLKDIKLIMSECARVLRPGKICTIIIGTNSNQLSKIHKKPVNEVQGLDEVIIEIGRIYKLKLIRKIERRIIGIANKLRTEYIILFQK